MFGRPVHTLQSATSGWRDLWLNTWSKTLSVLFSTKANSSSLSSSYSWWMIQDISETFIDFLLAATITLRLLKETSNRLGDLQISKIKSPTNINLCLCELLNSNFGTWFSLDIFLGMLIALMSQNLQWSSQLQLAGRCGVFIGGDPKGEMTKVTWCDSLTLVHNGRNSNQCATLLEEQ